MHCTGYTAVITAANTLLCRVYTRPKRAPLDNEYILGIALQHKQHLLVAAVTVVLCTVSNLAAPVLSGMLFEHLVQQHPMERYAKVGRRQWLVQTSKRTLASSSSRYMSLGQREMEAAPG